MGENTTMHIKKHRATAVKERAEDRTFAIGRHLEVPWAGGGYEGVLRMHQAFQDDSQTEEDSKPVTFTLVS